MRTNVFSRLVFPILLFAVAACDPFETRLDILDAAEIYSQNIEAFERVRRHYPGPYVQSVRIPEFDLEESRAEDLAFLEEIQKELPVETIKLYRQNSESDVIDMVLGTYGLSVSGRTVGVAFFEAFSQVDANSNQYVVFESCNKNVLDWFKNNTNPGMDVAYCQLENNWFAYQVSN